MLSFNKLNYVIIVFLLSVFTFSAIFLFRAFDDNRLTSWSWVFENVSGVKIYFILILGIVLAYIFSNINPPIPPLIKGGKGGLFLFLFSFLIVLPFWKESEVIIDASRYFTQAKHLELYGAGYFLREWGKGIQQWTDLPLIPFLYGLIFKFFGESRIYIQIFTTLLFSLTVVLTFKTGKILWDRDTGLAAGLLLLGIPYIYTQVPLMLVDIPTMFFFMLSVFTFINALEKGGVWLLFSSISIFLAFFSKYSTWLMLSVLAVILVSYSIKPSNKSGIRNQGSNSKLQTTNYIYRGVLIISITALLTVIVFLYKYDIFSEQIKLLMSYQRPMLKSWGESFLSTFFFQIHPFITISAIYSFYLAFKKKDLRYAIISYLVILIVLTQIKRIRYTVIIFPMLALMASYGLQKIRDKELRRFTVLSIVISSIVIALFVYLPFLEKTNSVNLKDAGEFLDSLKIESVKVFTMPMPDTSVNPAVSVPILDLFTEKRIYYDYNLYSPPPMEEIEKSPLRFTWGYRNPEYYRSIANTTKAGSAVAVISGKPDEMLPPLVKQEIMGYHNFRVFKADEGIFQYKTFVKVFW